MKEYKDGKIIYTNEKQIKQTKPTEQIEKPKTWKLIQRDNGISNIIDENLDITEIYLSEHKDYDWKIVGEKEYHINILEMDFKHQMIYAQVKEMTK